MHARGRATYVGCLAGEILERPTPALRAALIEMAESDPVAEELVNVFELRPQRRDDRPSGASARRRARVTLDR